MEHSGNIKFYEASLKAHEALKNELLSQVAEEYALDVKAKPFANLVKEAFISGAKWQENFYKNIDLTKLMTLFQEAMNDTLLYGKHGFVVSKDGIKLLSQKELDDYVSDSTE